MNTCKIAYDGRVTFWNTRLKTVTHREQATQVPSLEWLLFASLPPQGKRIFLLSGMGSSHVTNLDASLERVPRARRGSKGITSYARSLIRMGAQALEDRHGIKCLSFLTLTLPESALAVCTPHSWSQVVNRFLKSLSRRLTRAKLSPLVCGCVEVQEERLRASSRRPPLHLHLLFQGRSRGGSWGVRSVEFQELWAQACQSVWHGSRGFQSSSRVESLRSSGVSYLGKYMSKGGKVLANCDPELIPSSWHVISRNLKNFVQKSEFRVSGELSVDLYYWLRNRELLLWVKEVWSQQCADGSYFLMAWCGAIAGRKWYWELVDRMRRLTAARANSKSLRFSLVFSDVV